MVGHVHWRGIVQFRCILKFHSKAGYRVSKEDKCSLCNLKQLTMTVTICIYCCLLIAAPQFAPFPLCVSSSCHFLESKMLENAAFKSSCSIHNLTNSVAHSSLVTRCILRSTTGSLWVSGVEGETAVQLPPSALPNWNSTPTTLLFETQERSLLIRTDFQCIYHKTMITFSFKGWEHDLAVKVNIKC